MDSKAQLTADTFAKVAEGKIDVVNAAKLLNKSRRTIVSVTRTTSFQFTKAQTSWRHQTAIEV